VLATVKGAVPVVWVLASVSPEIAPVVLTGRLRVPVVKLEALLLKPV
jgi:hypothetical protein